MFDSQATQAGAEELKFYRWALLLLRPVFHSVPLLSPSYLKLQHFAKHSIAPYNSYLLINQVVNPPKEIIFFWRKCPCYMCSIYSYFILYIYFDKTELLYHICSNMFQHRGSKRIYCYLPFWTRWKFSILSHCSCVCQLLLKSFFEKKQQKLCCGLWVPPSTQAVW